MSADTGMSIPPGFWGLPSVQHVLDHRDVGVLLSMVIQESGMSQHALADLLGMPQPQISGYIRGVHKPTMDTVKRLADRLAMPPQARQRLGLSLTAVDTAPAVRISEILDLAEHIGRTHDITGLDTWREATIDGGTDDMWAHVSQVMSVQPPARLRGLERLRARTGGFFYAAAKLPARLVIETLTYHVNDIALLLDSIPDASVRRRLASDLGEATYLAACCHIDLGDQNGALSRLEMTSETARQSDDAALAAVALDGRSHLQVLRGDHQEALSLVAEGLEAAMAARSPGTLAYLHTRAAIEQLALGRSAQAVRSWAQAESCYAETDLTADRGWVRVWLVPDTFESLRAFLYSCTGRAEEAASVAEGVAARLSGARGKSDAVALVNAAFALATAGKLTRASRVGRQALEAVRASEAAGCMPRAQVVADMIRNRGRLTSSSRAYIGDVEATRRHLDALRLAPAI